MNTSVETTLPLPHTGRRTHHHQPGDRLTWTYLNEHDHSVRVVGTVSWSNNGTFVVTWDDQQGEARFTHNFEPENLRPATPRDEHEVRHTTRRSVAAELLRLADLHRNWPPHVQTTLRVRAAELSR